jgi:cystathionine gamma-synthase/cystathionine gamma-lyase/cystathionine beta-lyase
MIDRSKSDTRRIETQAIHAGAPRPRTGGALVEPIFQSATFETEGAETNHHQKYARLSNTPSHDRLQKRIAALEGAEAGLVAASGMSAISTAMATVLRPGDRLLAQDVLYGGTFEFVTKELPRLGVAVDLIDGARPETWEAMITPKTRAIYVESITNPLLRVTDLKHAVELARTHDLVSMIDATFTSPANFRAGAFGFDLVLHSATKYLNGHSDVVCGAIAGRADLVEAARVTMTHFGGSLDPHAAFLFERGLKTLPIRVQRQNENALRLAEALEREPGVQRVHYPGLASSPDHDRAAAMFAGCGGVFSFELEGGVATADRFISALTIPTYTPSLGGVETLVTLPVRTSHVGLSPEQRSAMGVTDALVRVSVGIEHADDLITDFKQALVRAFAAGAASV